MAKGKYHKWLEKDGIFLLECWARDGLSDEQLAHNMKINVSTLYDYLKKYPKISEAIKKGKEVVDYEVENALLKRATGYEYEEVQQFMEEKNGTTTKKIIKTKKHVPADTGAAIFWLKNRKSDKWRDRQENTIVNKQECNTDDLSGLDFSKISGEELKKIEEIIKTIFG